MADIGDIIKRRRITIGLSQEELSQESQLSLRTIQRIENNASNPRGYSIKAIAKVLDIPLQELTRGNRGHEDETMTKLSLINLSALVVLVIPYGNLLAPLFLWIHYRKGREVDRFGRSIINFQLSWVLATSLVLLLSPFVQLLFIPQDEATTLRPVLLVYLIAVVYNIVAVFRTSKKIKRKEFTDLYKYSLKAL